MDEDTSGNRTEKEPPKPQHSSAPGSSTSSTPDTPRSSARGEADSPSPRSRWQESWYVTFPRNGDSIVVTPSTSTMNCESSRVRRASESAAARSAGSCLSRPGYSVRTIQAQEPDGTTTCSAPSKSRTVRAATRAASWW